MLPMKKAPGILLIGLFMLTACSSADESSAAPETAIASPQPTATEVKVFPTPSSRGDSIIWQDLQVSMDQTEITESFITEFGSQRVPSAGQKFLWVHVTIKNVGKSEIRLPAPEHFSMLYAESEFKPTYGHRQGYAEYTALGPVIFPNQELDAWLRFDIPTAAELNEMRFVFLPESSQVGVSPASPNYPYADHKPTYVWQCEP
ncbi:MAG TPA: DUF4352 domain-containing protein [Anaerolineales bacterium]|nr:DUF4352 domain-containing protein [Anaerolineales bacterium]